MGQIWQVGVLSFCLLTVRCASIPLGESHGSTDKYPEVRAESQEKNPDVHRLIVASNSENSRRSCIQTVWGCIDLTDPAFRPRLHNNSRSIASTTEPSTSTATSTENKDDQEKLSSTNTVARTTRRPRVECIPTKWGCIDVTDPAFRPRFINIWQSIASTTEVPINEENRDERERVEMRPIEILPIDSSNMFRCSQTIWGCLILEKVPDTTKSNIGIGPPVFCIPTLWGCIDLNDPAFRP